MTAERILSPPRAVWTVTVRCDPWSVNDERRWHHHKRAKRVAQVRRDAGWEAKALGIPNLGAATVTARPVFGNRRRRQDAGNAYSVAKAALDGLVDAGVLDDDDAAHVPALTMLAPGYDITRGPYLTLRLRPLSPLVLGKLVH